MDSKSSQTHYSPFSTPTAPEADNPSKQQGISSITTPLKPIIYRRQKKRKKEKSYFKYAIGLPELILLKLLNKSQENIKDIYEEEDFYDNITRYFAILQSLTDSKLTQLVDENFQVESFQIFKQKDPKLISRNLILPDYIWIDNLKGVYSIEEDLQGYKMNFFSFQGNLIVQCSSNRKDESEVFVTNLKNGKYIKRSQGSALARQIAYKPISSYLSITLRENQSGLLRKFEMIETAAKVKNFFRRFNVNQTIDLVLQFENVLDMLTFKSRLQQYSVQMHCIPQTQFDKLRTKIRNIRESSPALTFNIHQAVSQLKQADILGLQRYFNTTGDQFYHSFKFIIDNSEIYFPHHYQLLKVVHQILKQYSLTEEDELLQDGSTAEWFDKRFILTAQYSKLLIPMLHRIVQSNEGDQPGKGFRGHINNQLLALFVKNCKLAVTQNGQLVLDEGGNKCSLSQRIATYHEFQGYSTRVARWDHIYQSLGIQHSLSHLHSQEQTSQGVQYDIKGEINQKAQMPEGQSDQDQNVQEKGEENQSKEDRKKRLQRKRECQNQLMKRIEEQVFPNLQCLGCTTFFYFGFNIRNINVCSTPYRLIQSACQLKKRKDEIKEAMMSLMASYGGVILFDCKAKHRQVLPKGCTISAQEQDQIKAQLEAIFSQLYNTDDKEIEKQINVTFVPVRRNPFQYPVKNGERSFKKDTYVTRVKINRFLNKQKQKQATYLNQQEERQIAFLRPKITCFHTGPCLDPEVVKKKGKNAPAKQLLPQYQFKDVTIALLKSNMTPNLLQLKLNGKQIKCKVEARYKDELKCTANTALVFHSCPMDQIVEYCQNYHLQVSFFKVTYFIYLPNRSKDAQNITQKDLEDLLQHSAKFQEEFEDEPVAYWRYKRNDGAYQYYFHLKSKARSALLYYLLRQCGEKCKFRYPKDYNQLEDRNILNKFHLCFHKNQTKSRDMEQNNQSLQKQIKNNLCQFFKQLKKKEGNI